MKFARITARFAAPVLGALAIISCSDAGGAARITGAEPALASGSLGATLVECPVETSKTASALVGPLGGVVSVDGHSLVIPPLAVLVPTQFTVTVPAGNYVEVDIRAGNAEHYTFQKPVSLTLSYARCSRANIGKEALKIFYIDEQTNAILEDMGGTDDKTARTVTVGTGHLSGYAIGQGRTAEDTTTVTP